MIRFTRNALLASVVLALIACGDREEPAVALPATATSAAQHPGGRMSSAGSMHASGTDMMGGMTAYMGAMDGMSMDSLQRVMPMYGERVDAMLGQMNRDMSARSMAADARWDATVDSIGSDLTRIQGMSATELQTFMPEHRARVMWMMETHRRMMSGAGS